MTSTAACHSTVGSWTTLSPLTFNIPSPLFSINFFLGTRRSRSRRKSGLRLNLVLLSDLLQRSPALLPLRWNQLSSLMWEMIWEHDDHQGEWESNEASEDVFKDLLRVKKLSQRVSSVESKPTHQHLLCHWRHLMSFSRRRPPFDGVGDGRQREHPLGEQRPSGELRLQAVD